MTLTLTPRAVSSSIAGIPAAVAGHLDHHVGSREPLPESSACSIVAAVSSARSGVHSKETKPSRPVAGLVGRAQQVGGAADVVERELEEQLLRRADAGRDGVAKLVVVEIGAGDRLGEDRRVRGRAGDRASRRSAPRRRRCPAARARACRARSRRRRRAAACRRFTAALPSSRERAPRAGRRGRRGAGRRRQRARG